MTTKLLTPHNILQTQLIRVNDYLQLTKPKVVALLLLTAMVGMFLATPNTIPMSLLLAAMVGFATAMGAAATINQVVDKRIDCLMDRTQNRPLASNRISPQQAIIFASCLCIISAFLLTQFVNPLTAILTLSGLVGYAVIYTMYLKRTTPQNIVIGGLAGALPPLLGWTAVTNQIDPHSLLLVLIIFVWTPPHFWALAIHRRLEYANAKIPMLPITHGVAFTKTCILLYTILLSIITLLPYLTQMSGFIYLIGTVILNIFFLYYAIRLKWSSQPNVSIKTFSFSIVYLFSLFILLLVDHNFFIK